MNVKHSRLSIRGHSPVRILILPALVLVFLAAVLPVLQTSPEGQISRDADLCPTDRESIAGSAVFLFDFTKPLGAEQPALPGQLFRQVSDGLGPDVELQVFSLTGSTAAPRALLRRLCKPFDSETRPERGNPAGRDCPDIVAASGSAPGESAARFCAIRDALEEKLNAMASREWPEDQPVPNAYLVEAIEDTRLDFAERPKPHWLYVYSDMMQHAPWYSHLDISGDQWSFDEFAESLKSHRWMSGQLDGFADTKVELFYVPRIGITDRAGVRRIHQEFWQSYFGDALTAIHDQPPMRGYRSAPLTDASAAAQIAGQDRAAIERQILEIQRERETLASELQTLEAERLRQEAAQARRLAELQTTLERRREALAERRRLAETEPDKAETDSAMRSPQNASHVDDTEETTAEELLAEAQSAPEPPPPCQLEYTADLQAMRPNYPRNGRVDFGSARITVQYLVDEEGETVNDQVSLVPDLSRADRERHFSLFAKNALDKVRSWSFAFVEHDDRSCTRRQTRTTSFAFNFQ